MRLTPFLPLLAALMLLAAPAQAQGAASAFPNAVSAEAGRPQVPAVVLKTAGGKPVDLAALKGKWIWLYFGFAHCPGICPTTLDQMAAEMKRLKHPEQVQPIFVSVDPDRDTPDTLGPYAAYFHPQLVGATGDRAAIDALVAGVGASYVIPPGVKPTDNYMVGHPNLIYVLDPQGRLAATYQPSYGDDVGKLAADTDAEIENPTPVVTAPAVKIAPPTTTGGAWCGIPPGMEGDPTERAFAALMARARILGSGTGVLPGTSPMRMYNWRLGDWLVMAHGDVVAGVNRQGGARGDAMTPSWVGENWQMVQATRFLGPGIVDLRAMTSLENWTLPAGGTPQLFQSGETYQNRVLIDRQHPHDLFMDLSARYTWNLNDQAALFAYGALAGDPALGPSAAMHRPSAADNHWAPLGHHFQDSTHISYGVATLGARLGDFQLEGSAFNGREPDENRVGFDFGPLDSWAARLTYFPGRQWSLQASMGHLKNPERLHPGDVRRLTASATHVAELPFGVWSTSLIWGQNNEQQAPLADLILQSYGIETQLDAWQVNHLYGRYELLDRTGLPPYANTSHVTQRLQALTVGYVRDLDTSDAFDLGLGGDVTLYAPGGRLPEAYGNPVSFRVYLRLRPPTMP